MINPKHNRSFILRKLSMSDQEYCELVERGGYVWLDKYLFHAPDAIKAASYSRLFWAWWVNEWNIRDESFVKDIRFSHPNIEQKEYYFKVHAISKLLIRPNRWAISEINKIITHQVLQQVNEQNRR